MNRVQVIFLFGCFVIRFLLAFIVKIIDKKYLHFLPIISLPIILMFLNNYLKYKPGNQGFFKNTIWWNNYRLVHFLTFGLFSIMVFFKTTQIHAWKILLLDAILGLIFFVHKYY